MKLKVCYSKRVIFRDISFFLLLFSLVFSFPMKIEISSFIALGMLFFVLGYYYSGVFFENSYLYLSNKKTVSSITDPHIKIEDIVGFSTNNPFPVLSRWCKSSNNLTLYLIDGKQKTVSVNENGIIISWLVQNNISNIRKLNLKNIVWHIIYTIINILTISLCLYNVKIQYTDLGLTLFLISILCFFYWIFYIISGVYMLRNGFDEQ